MRAHNVHGWSPAFSTETLVLASEPPAKPDPITTVINNKFVRIAWSSYINNNFEALDKYQILIEDAVGEFREQLVSCDGTNLVIVAQRFCDVPMITLTSAPYSLSEGTLIRAKVRAHNKIGWSVLSDLNTLGVVAQTTPS